MARQKNMDLQLGHIFSKNKTSNKICSEDWNLWSTADGDENRLLLKTKADLSLISFQLGCQSRHAHVSDLVHKKHVFMCATPSTPTPRYTYFHFLSRFLQHQPKSHALDYMRVHQFQKASQGQPVTVVFSTDKNHCFPQKTIIPKCSWKSDPW